jgi:hypothetical protein
MIYTKIYKIKIFKAKQKLFDLWWKDLIKLQDKYIKVIEKILEKQYKWVLKELEQNPEVKYNDLYVDQEQFIEKDFEDFVDQFVNMVAGAFAIWIKQLNKLMKREVTVEANFWLSNEAVIEYARWYAGARITMIDNYTKKRINKLITFWLEEWWWYKKLADELRKDYWFSRYRATLIASNEIGTSFIQWRNKQFEEYRAEFNPTWWWKKWTSHKDDRTTEWCLTNDNAWWIKYDQEYPSWHYSPPRFPWCRCTEDHRLFEPYEDLE